MTRTHARIIQYPFAASFQGALLDSYHEEYCDGKVNITLHIRAFERTSSKLVTHKGVIHEQVQGKYVPAQLYFADVSELKRNDYFASINALSPNDPNRTFFDLLSWKPPERQDTFHLFYMQSPEADSLMFFARQTRFKRSPRGSTNVSLERDWSPPPSMPQRLIPMPKLLHERYGGDPITIQMNGRIHHHKLFIGGVDIQPQHRPKVDAVLNLGEKPSRWLETEPGHPNDRSVEKGECFQGMSVNEIGEEANWVIDRLKKDESVLVHCVAGMNRSATICCAVLMLLEGLSAKAALERVREHHPWARPDVHHWLALRWLNFTNKGKNHGS
jgi:hypothetical protein